LLVVLYHFAAVFFPAILTGDIAIAHGGWDAALHRSPLWALLNGEFDVAVFFVLSGYVLTRDAFATGDPTSLRHRAAGRLLRLALPAGASTLAVFALLHAGAYRLTEAQALTGADAVFPSRLLFHFPWDGASLLDNLLWRTWFAPADVTRMYNLALWTMPVEFWGSCIVFAAGLVVVRTRLAPAFLVALALVLFRAVPRDGVALGIFVGGAALAAVPSWSGRTRRWPVRVRWSSWLGVALAAAGLAFASYNAMRPFGLPGLEPATVYGAGAVMVVAAVLLVPPLQRLFACRPLVALGRISFPLYLVHQPVIYSLGATVFIALAPSGYVRAAAVSFAAVMAVSLPLAVAGERWIDRPSARLAHRFARFILRPAQPCPLA
jgi:peptidoglycan/LPS O-acetylase OafA/YrhL